jgi:thiosulfate/3-mercaptopyruvate sulfurtransferase
VEYAHPESLVSTDWLLKHLHDENLRVVDASFFLPTDPRNPAEEYAKAHIPGAVFFDINDIADKSTGLPHMLPSAEVFAERVGQLGIGQGDKIVVYDRMGGAMAAARVWWTFHVFGYDNVAVLDGGLEKWTAEGRQVDSRPRHPDPRKFTAEMDHNLVRDFGNMLANVESRREQMVDARGAGRFAGTDPEPRPAKHRGHIPGSKNVPFDKLQVVDKHRVFRSADEIAAAFKAAGIDLGQPIAATCGSGVTAAYLAFALHLIGRSDIAVYDGSWAEWGNADDAPIER